MLSDTGQSSRSSLPSKSHSSWNTAHNRFALIVVFLFSEDFVMAGRAQKYEIGKGTFSFSIQVVEPPPPQKKKKKKFVMLGSCRIGWGRKNCKQNGPFLNEPVDDVQKCDTLGVTHLSDATAGRHWSSCSGSVHKAPTRKCEIPTIVNRKSFAACCTENTRVVFWNKAVLTQHGHIRRFSGGSPF